MGFCNRFSLTEEFRSWQFSDQDVLARLSQARRSSRYIIKLVSQRLDLLHDETYDMQLIDLATTLKDKGVGASGLRFVLEAVPRLNPDEAIQQLRTQA